MIVTACKNLVSERSNILLSGLIDINCSRKLFEQYKGSGVIKNRSYFDDVVWYATDEYSNVGLYFDFNEIKYCQYQEIFLQPYGVFVDYTKAFVLSLFGKLVLESIESFLLDIKTLLGAPPQEIISSSSDLNFYSVHWLMDFLQIFNNDENSDDIDSLLDSLEIYSYRVLDSAAGFNQRTLADFRSYFEFSDILKDYWSNDLPDSERLFYFPLYLWWNISAIIPLRPREFLLTQRDCLISEKGDTYKLKFRRNQLKGSSKDWLSYKIDSSYLIQEIPIPNTIASSIQSYLDLTKDFEPTQLNTLFLPDPHMNWFKLPRQSRNRFFSYNMMSTLLRSFFFNIVQDKYGFVIKFCDEPVNHDAKEIKFFHLGDSRTIALVNLMQEGSNPITAMLLAGQESIDTASHYFSNVVSLIECDTYRAYRKMLSGDNEFKLSNYCRNTDFSSSNASLLSDGSLCFSPGYLSHEYADCKKAIGPNGEIGYCPSCYFHRGKGESYFSGDNIYKNRIENDCLLLHHSVQALRASKGNIEDLYSALLRLQSSSYSYKRYRIEKLMNEGLKEHNNG